jgi:glycosyltransferase involved in cell wall biosynthesis
MNYHIALSRPFNLEEIAQTAAAGKCPRHALKAVCDRLNATVHQPYEKSILPSDRLLAQLIGKPEHWVLARRLVSQLRQDDVIFCTGEDIGFPLAILCRNNPQRPKIAVCVMATQRLRVLTLIKLFRLTQAIDLFLTETQIKRDAFQQSLRLPDHRVQSLSIQTDTQFFKPGACDISKSRPLIVSAGLEHRDYQTLAEAVSGLEVDVKICAVSPNASRRMRVRFPQTMPSNMTAHPYDWPEFLQLYRDADIIVLSLLDNRLSAGLTTLMEAMACDRPVIATRTPGLISQLIDGQVITGVNPSDPMKLRQAIAHLLQHPEQAKQQARRGYERVLQYHTTEQYVEELVTLLQSMGTLSSI